MSVITAEFRERFAKTSDRFGNFLRELFPGQEKLVGVEIGVYVGTHAKKMLLAAPNLFLYACDMWELNVTQGNVRYTRDEADNYGKRMGDIRQALRVKGEALKTLAPFAARCELVKSSSLEFAKRFKGEADFVYIDGDHSYSAVSEDVMAWFPRVALGGLLCGHDYNTAGCIKAVDEFRTMFGLPIATNQPFQGDWMLGPIAQVHRDRVASWQEALASKFPATAGGAA